MRGRWRDRLARARDDRGAVLVEFAFVAPVLFGLLLGLADFALIELGETAGANAAREGARKGIIHFEDAHNPASDSYETIVEAVESKLGGLVKGTPTVTVRCLESDGVTLISGTGTCAAAAVEEGIDLLQVSVTWEHIVATPGVDRFTTDVATMRIVGTPPAGGGSGTGSCALSEPEATPAEVGLAGTVLDQDVTFRVTVSSTSGCGVPLITLPEESGLVGSYTMGQVGTTNVYEFLYDTSLVGGQLWTTGVKTAQFQALAGTVTAAASFEIPGLNVCEIESATPNVVNVSINGAGKVRDAVTIRATVNDVVLCGLTLDLVVSEPPDNPYTGAQAMTIESGTTYKFTIPKNQTGWDSETGTITITGGLLDEATTSLQINVG